VLCSSVQLSSRPEQPARTTCTVNALQAGTCAGLERCTCHHQKLHPRGSNGRTAQALRWSRTWQLVHHNTLRSTTLGAAHHRIHTRICHPTVDYIPGCANIPQEPMRLCRGFQQRRSLCRTPMHPQVYIIQSGPRNEMCYLPQAGHDDGYRHQHLRTPASVRDLGCACSQPRSACNRKAGLSR
jgi:hypothetical protein